MLDQRMSYYSATVTCLQQLEAKSDTLKTDVSNDDANGRLRLRLLKRD
jgi:hypothetical protein